MKADKQAKRKARAKERLKARKQEQLAAVRAEKADYFFHEALWFYGKNEPENALVHLEKALRCAPGNIEMLRLLGLLGSSLKRPATEIQAMRRLLALGALSIELYSHLAYLLLQKKRYREALEIAEAGLVKLARKRFKGVAQERRLLEQIIETSRAHMKAIDRPRLDQATAQIPDPGEVGSGGTAATVQSKPEPVRPAPAPPAVPVTVAIDRAAFMQAMDGGRLADAAAYALCLQAHRIRFHESFESLICLAGLHQVRSIWYQEETARKVLRDFRGRALMADEVGLGKTIEALIVLKEYLLRGMVNSALILTPTPLVSQWQQELRTKFALAVPSTDDSDFRAQGTRFWQAPLVIASINIAKSRKHFEAVVQREYDLVIVDEAHHLKNRSTLNWKLVNALQKRFLLLLTATPVENNLMELYNLITLLKPGQLKTPSEFKAEFMTRGDPTTPQNRTRLRGLLNPVMIRNTRALAKINLPPRYAYTVRIDPSDHEAELYQRVTDLVRDLNAGDGLRRRGLLKHLLAEAGSSPPAVAKTVSGLLQDPDLTCGQHDMVQAIVNLTRSMDDTRKNAMLHDLLRAMPGKTIIFVKYLATLHHVSDFLTWQRIPHALFHGSLDNAAKERQIEAFRQTHDVLVTTEIGGEGRNMQFCHQMINYDLPWNPMRIEQRIGRIHRIGQEHEVVIQNLCAGGSAEDYILEILDRKINMFEMVIGEIDMILGRIRGEAEFSELVYAIWVGAASTEERRRGFDRLAAQLTRGKSAYIKSRHLDAQLFGDAYEL